MAVPLSSPVHRALLAVLLLVLLPVSPVSAQAPDARTFPHTGYRVGDDAFWGYFNGRGGVRTFGYPVSNPFTLHGFQVQVFQRAILQKQLNGTVAIANVLDEGLLPYTTINGSSFPAADPEVIRRQPQVGEPNYHQKALQFVKETAPDTWQGQPVGFFKTFAGTVRAAEAFPNGGVSEGLLLGFNLEVWGLPTSQPTADPSNAGFVYQRFQRGIMHYDDSCKCTQGLLLADYLKSILTLQNLPPDLAAQAQASPFYGQLDPGRPGWLKRPAALPDSDLTNAFIGAVAAADTRAADTRTGALSIGEAPGSITINTNPTPAPTPAPTRTPTPGRGSPVPAAPGSVTPTPTPTSVPISTPVPLPTTSAAAPGKGTVFVDAGHGGKEIGASATFGDGLKLVEKELNLKVAMRLAGLLRDAGIGVTISRTSDGQVNDTRDLNNDGRVNLTDDLQARVDLANGAKADLLISVHFNGIDDPSKKGTQTFYSEGRPFSDKNRLLAELVQASLVRHIRAAGYETADRGATSDSRVLGQGNHYYLLGPESPTIRRASQMPGIIGEPLFLTNPEEAQALRGEKVQEAVARAYFEAIRAYFERHPPK